MFFSTGLVLRHANHVHTIPKNETSKKEFFFARNVPWLLPRNSNNKKTKQTHPVGRFMDWGSTEFLLWPVPLRPLLEVCTRKVRALPPDRVLRVLLLKVFRKPTVASWHRRAPRGGTGSSLRMWLHLHDCICTATTFAPTVS